MRPRVDAGAPGGFRPELCRDQESATADPMLDFLIDYLPLFMFCSLGLLLFSGLSPSPISSAAWPVLFGVFGFWLDVFEIIEFFNFLPRVWGQAAENLVLVAAPLFVFMGVMMERSGVANDMLYVCQVLLRRVPGALALAVTVMGTILAAHDRNHRRLGDHADRAGPPADDAQAGLSPVARDRRNCRIGLPRHSHPAPASC